MKWLKSSFWPVLTSSRLELDLDLSVLQGRKRFVFSSASPQLAFDSMFDSMFDSLIDGSSIPFQGVGYPQLSAVLEVIIFNVTKHELLFQQL